MAASRTSRLVVGEVEGDFALLTTTEQQVPIVFRIPLALLPHGVHTGACAFPFRLQEAPLHAVSATSPHGLAGHVIEMATSRNTDAEIERDADVRSLQADLRARLGGSSPQLPSVSDAAVPS